ncbi:hypothetical protein AB0N87_34925 [Streptomyces sp. NPDC093228]|uniref:hypothetical protein n=1 Tax=Streptomyces sp. NPDC093228 TaxID=3155070 RepID=UPI00344631CA
MVVTDAHGRLLWSAGTRAGRKAVFQADGDLVVQDGSGSTVWHSGSGGHPGAQLVLQGDGNVTIDRNAVPLWQTGTWT